MGLREELREKYTELDKIYGETAEFVHEEETSNNPMLTEWETDQYNLVLGAIDQACKYLDQAIDNIPYPY